ncbi:MAG: hypothetical protein GY841_22000, partial [FCB group bacterium]|nr:hypothetical protein [FCB group bacterium]
YKRRINKKQRNFCSVYASAYDVGKALKASGYSKTSNITRMMKLPHIAEAIEVLHEKYMLKLGMSESAILQQLINCAYSSTSEFYDKKGKLIPIHKLPKALTRTITEVKADGSYKLEGRKEYIKMLMRYKSMFNDRIQIGLTEDMLEMLVKVMPPEFSKAVKEALDKYLVLDK